MGVGAMPRVMVFEGTTNGLYVLESDARRARWRQRGPYLKGRSVNHFAWDPRTRTVCAATHDVGLLASRTLGRTWVPLNGGLPIRKVWSVAEGYLKAPGSEHRYGDWGFRTAGNAIHGIHFDPRTSRRAYVVSSADHRAVRTDDGGKTWGYIRSGVFESYPAAADSGFERPTGGGAQERTVAEHLSTVHTCTHRVGIARSRPRVLYRQQHCGVLRQAMDMDDIGTPGVYLGTTAGEVYASADVGDTWRLLAAGLPRVQVITVAVA